MKAQSAEMQAHRRLGTTTFAQCWRVVWLDNQVFGFTSLDRNLVIDGITYLAASGFMASSMAASADLAVQNMDLSGILDSDAIREQDLIEGRWDGAFVEVFEVNYADLTMGKMILCSGTLGNVTAGALSFSAEMRGLTQQMQQGVGEVFTPACATDFGSARCGLAIASYTFAGTVTTVSATENARSFSASALVQASDYFGGGYVHWLTGANAGLRMEVRSFAATAIMLVLPMANAIALGDTFEAIAGCRKRPEDCKTKFASNNIVNFRGFPHVPLNDKALGNAGTTG